MRATILDRPVADLGAVELERMQARGFRGREAVGAGRGAGQAFLEEVDDWIGPGGGMVAARGSRNPQTFFLVDASTEESGGKSIEATAGNAQLRGGCGGRRGVLPEGRQHMADERGSMTI
jgi:hypothetical protein